MLTLQVIPSAIFLHTSGLLAALSFSGILRTSFAGRSGIITPAFSPVLVAQGVLLAGTIASKIFYAGARLPEFKGTITDMGGPTANLYGAACKKWPAEGYCGNRGCLEALAMIADPRAEKACQERQAVRVRDADELRAAVLHLARNPGLSAEMGDRARRAVIEQKGASRRIMELIRQGYRQTGLQDEGGAFARACLLSNETGLNVAWFYVVHLLALARQNGVEVAGGFPDDLWFEGERTFNWRHYENQR